MKIVNGSNRVIMAPFGNSMITVMPHNVSGDVVANRELVRAIITSGRTNEVGLVTYSSAELQLINDITGAAPFIHEDIEEAIKKLIPEGIKPVVEQRVIQGGEPVLVQTEIAIDTQRQSIVAESGIKELVDGNETLKLENKKLKEQISSLETSNKSLKSKISELQNSVSNNDTADLDKALSDAQTTNKNLEKLLSESQSENAKLTEEHEVLKSNFAKKVAEINKLSDEKDSEISDLSKTIDEKSLKISELEKEVETLKSQENLSDNSVEISEYVEKLRVANESLERFRRILNNTVKTNELTWDPKGEQYIKAVVTED